MKAKRLSAILLLSILVMGCGGEASEKIETTEMSGELSAIVQNDEAEEIFMASEEADVAESLAESVIGAESNTELVEYRYENLCLSVEIPDGWEYEIRTAEELAMEDGLVVCAIEFWHAEYPEAVFELGYQSTRLGLCFTGVTVEEFTLSNGLCGCRYTEEMGDVLWMNITLDNLEDNISDGTYLISATPNLTDWEAIKEEFKLILESVWVGTKRT